MAPEVLLRRNYSYPSDVFSYGMVLFEMMAKKRPYEGRLFEVPDLSTSSPIYPIFAHCNAKLLSLSPLHSILPDVVA